MVYEGTDQTTIATDVSYTAPVAGTSAVPDGTDGSYVFTVTVSKGAQSQTTVQKTLTITAIPYTGVTDVDAVAAAKDAVVDGTVTVPTGANQADKTAAVQSYVNDRLAAVPSAAGVTATVTYNSGTGKYDVALSKGTVSDSKSITMTVNESADPDISIVTAAKTAAENANYAATTQTATGTESSAQTYVQNIATTAVNNSGVTVTVDKVSYTVPMAGTSSDRDGTNGSYIFTITVSKGGQSQTTTQITVVITATAYSGSTGGDGGGSTGGSTTTPPTSKSTEPVTGNTENKATVDDKGNANVSISDKNITDAITNAKAGADKKGMNAGEITAVINVTTGGKDATTVSVNLPKVVQEQVIDRKIAKVELVIDRPDLTIGMNLSAVTEINKRETLVFTTNHFSVYGVGFKATSLKFTDTADHWAKDSIDFVVSRGLMNGTSATTFSPNDGLPCHHEQGKPSFLFGEQSGTLLKRLVRRSEDCLIQQTKRIGTLGRSHHLHIGVCRGYHKIKDCVSCQYEHQSFRRNPQLEQQRRVGNFTAAWNRWGGYIQEGSYDGA